MAISLVVALTLSMFPFIAIAAIIILLIYTKYNVASGIILFISIAFGGFIIFPGLYVISPGDIYYTIGGYTALRLTFRNRKPGQTPYKTGIIVGIVGASVSSFFISIHQWFLFTILIDVVFFGYYLVAYMPFDLVLGVIIGFIYGYIKKKQEEDDDE
ncbi:MAG: hypothetical protein ACW990_16240, partial [Promethearchaeota archaeon]